jgi:Na+/melibiose symporter-like transporter
MWPVRATRAILTSMAQQPTQAPPDTSRWRYKSVGAVVASTDFYCGVPAGLACGLLPMLSHSVAGNTQTVMLGVTGVAGALVALVLTAMTVLIAVISPAFGGYLDRLPHGLSGLLRPYHIVISVCAACCALAIISALAWPALQGVAIWRFFGAGVPIALLLWALGGCLQIVQLTSKTVSQSHQVTRIEERRQAASARMRGGAGPVS